MAWVETIPADTLDIGESTQYVLETGHKIALFRLDDGYYAIDDTCSHAEASLAEGDIVEDNVKCSLHGAEFDIRSGAVKSFPAVIGVGAYQTKVEDNTIFINYEE